MIYAGLAFAIALTSLFIWQSMTAVRTGAFNAGGWSARRESAPFLYWSGLAGSVLCIVAGLFFVFIILSVIVVGPAGG